MSSFHTLNLMKDSDEMGIKILIVVTCSSGTIKVNIAVLLSWQQSHFVLFMISKASLLIQTTNINQLCIDLFVR